MKGNTHMKKHVKNINKHEFITANSSEGEMYAIIKKPLGDARFEVEILRTGKIVIAKLRGALIKGPKKQRIEVTNIVLLDNGSSDMYYIMLKYSDEEVKKLNKMGELISFKPKTTDVENTAFFFEGDVHDDNDDRVKIDDEFIRGI